MNNVTQLCVSENFAKNLQLIVIVDKFSNFQKKIYLEEVNRSALLSFVTISNFSETYTRDSLQREARTSEGSLQRAR